MWFQEVVSAMRAVCTPLKSAPTETNIFSSTMLCARLYPNTIVRATPDGKLAETLKRSELWNMQTPQCFPQTVIRKAYELGLQDPSFSPTDDCGVVMRYLPDVPIQLVPGEAGNIKITYPEDLK